MRTVFHFIYLDVGEHLYEVEHTLYNTYGIKFPNGTIEIWAWIRYRARCLKELQCVNSAAKYRCS
jgi:hypothetical protein